MERERKREISRALNQPLSFVVRDSSLEVLHDALLQSRPRRTLLLWRVTSPCRCYTGVLSDIIYSLSLDDAYFRAREREAVPERHGHVTLDVTRVPLGGMPFDPRWGSTPSSRNLLADP
jgi:hypothetical protein